MPDAGFTVFRFIANNPGVWMLHCHIDFHMESGMSFFLKVGDVKDFPKAPDNWPKCGSFSFKKEISNSSEYNKF